MVLGEEVAGAWPALTDMAWRLTTTAWLPACLPFAHHVSPSVCSVFGRLLKPESLPGLSEKKELVGGLGGGKVGQAGSRRGGREW